MKTTGLGLKKPDQADPVDVQDLNDNADVIDAELVKRPLKNGDASKMTVEFTEPDSLTELASNDTMKGLFGKLKLVTKNVISLVRLLGTTDISAIGGGTVTGAISQINNNFSHTIINRGQITSAAAKMALFPGLYDVIPSDAPAWMVQNKYGVLMVLSTGSNSEYASRPMLFISSDNALYFQWAAFNQPDYDWIQVK